MAFNRSIYSSLKSKIGALIIAAAILMLIAAVIDSTIGRVENANSIASIAFLVLIIGTVYEILSYYKVIRIK